MSHLLEVQDLATEFHLESGVLSAVNGVSYHVDSGEVVAFVGESGSGKSVTHYSGIQLVACPPGKIVGGRVLYEGRDLLRYSATGQEMRAIRGGKIGVVFQEPMTSLNPVMTIGAQIGESLALHAGMDRMTARARTVELLRQVGIPDAESQVDRYPHQFSGGMRQRIMIAMALSCGPELLIADEATTALDVTTQAQILELLRDMVRSTGAALVIITHNLSIVARYADRIYVMYGGQIVESGSCRAIFADPRSPYTIGLLGAVPGLDDPKDRRLVPIDGIAPSLFCRRDICTFLPRCPYATEDCGRLPSPKLRPVPEPSEADGSIAHSCACHREITRRSSPEKAAAVAPRSPRSAATDASPILEVEGLRIAFPILEGFFRRKVGELVAVDGVSFSVRRGECFGLVGESGCGKTTVARSVLRLLDIAGGSIKLDGEDLATMGEEDMRKRRRKVSMIFQDPYGSLDPRMKAGDIVGEPLRSFALARGEAEYRDRIVELFGLVGLDPALRDRVPHEFSGGQRQRIGIARALASEPSLIVCDEAISALDVSIQAQIINLLEELQDRMGLAYLFIAHDLTVVRHISDRLAVMYLGQVVETGDWRSVYEAPTHPYTQALLEAIPLPDPVAEAARPRKVIAGEVPSLANRPRGCPFSTRCPISEPRCATSRPPMRRIAENHEVACYKA
jgi:oligopeptide/dipeptide ABC transporter, ATP-binding protein, C-terminal domain